MAGMATARSAANIAFIKYWGARDLAAAIPSNPSFSMTLTECASRCTVRLFDDGEASRDQVYYREGDAALALASEGFARRVRGHLDRLRERTGYRGFCEVKTENSFPASAGLASSASGFSALALAFSGALGHQPDDDELSDRARLSGSGSATRSAMGGYVAWPAGPTHGERCPARQLFPADHWELHDVVGLVQVEAKQVSSLEGHALAPTSPHYAARLRGLAARDASMRRAVARRDFDRLAVLLEQEAVELHLVAMSSRPPIFYWNPGTLQVLSGIAELRGQGVEAACTMDAGANVHVICSAAAEPAVVEALEAMPLVQRVIRDRVGNGPELVAQPVA